MLIILLILYGMLVAERRQWDIYIVQVWDHRKWRILHSIDDQFLKASRFWVGGAKFLIILVADSKVRLQL